MSRRKVKDMVARQRKKAMLEIKKSGYHREPYTRKGGIKVKGTYVPPSTYKIKDRGAPGRGKKIIKIKHPGRLTSCGYKVKDPSDKRHVALKKCVNKYGEKSTAGMLRAQGVYRKRTDGIGNTFMNDASWVNKEYGSYHGKK